MNESINYTSTTSSINSGNTAVAVTTLILETELVSFPIICDDPRLNEVKSTGAALARPRFSDITRNFRWWTLAGAAISSEFQPFIGSHFSVRRFHGRPRK